MAVGAFDFVVELFAVHRFFGGLLGTLMISGAVILSLMPRSLTEKRIREVTVGMTRQQVQAILGSSPKRVRHEGETLERLRWTECWAFTPPSDRVKIVEVAFQDDKVVGGGRPEYWKPISLDTPTEGIVFHFGVDANLPLISVGSHLGKNAGIVEDGSYWSMLRKQAQRIREQ
jgi:hypothetical protein